VSATPNYDFLVKPHLDELKKYCFYLTRSKWDGDDLVQEAVLRAMVYFLDKEVYQDPKHFLFRVARNLWIDNRRSLTRQRKLPIWKLSVYYTDSNYVEVRSLIEWIAERLPRRNMEMFLLSDYFRYTMQEIADILNTTVPAVKSVLHRTHIMLRNLQVDADYKSDGTNVFGVEVDKWSKAIMRGSP
jgi:RNA polymerase sigma-70 factor (ECF subfamily)